MGRVYTVEFNDLTVPNSGAIDLFELGIASGKPISLHSVHLAQSNPLGTTDEEMLRVQVFRGHGTTGSGGSTKTPAKMLFNDTASGVTAKVGNTTVATGGTPITIHSDAFNNRAGWNQVWQPDDRPKGSSAEVYFVVRLATPVNAQRMSGTIIFEELL